jgi:CHC2 zinc finger/Toprim domain
MGKFLAVKIEDELARRGWPFWTNPRNNNKGQPCPMCGGHDRFSVDINKQLFNCRGCGKGGDVISLVRAFDGVGYIDALKTLGAPARKPLPAARKAAAAKVPVPSPVALAIWRQAVDPRGTLVEHYLAGRGLALPDDAAKVLRFHPNCSFGPGGRYPCMVALVRNILTNEPQAIQRTALNADGTRKRDADGKTMRLSLGPVVGGAVKLDADESVIQGLCIGEGVETTLSGMRMGLRPAWCLVSRIGIAKFPLLPGVEGLHILAEHDQPSQHAVAECVGRWKAARRAVLIAESETGKDLNDELCAEVCT